MVVEEIWLPTDIPAVSRFLHVYGNSPNVQANFIMKLFQFIPLVRVKHVSDRVVNLGLDHVNGIGCPKSAVKDSYAGQI